MILYFLKFQIRFKEEKKSQWFQLFVWKDSKNKNIWLVLLIYSFLFLNINTGTDTVTTTRHPEQGSHTVPWRLTLMIDSIRTKQVNYFYVNERYKHLR